MLSLQVDSEIQSAPLGSASAAQSDRNNSRSDPTCARVQVPNSKNTKIRKHSYIETPQPRSECRQFFDRRNFLTLYIVFLNVIYGGPTFVFQPNSIWNDLYEMNYWFIVWTCHSIKQLVYWNCEAFYSALTLIFFVNNPSKWTE